MWPNLWSAFATIKIPCRASRSPAAICKLRPRWWRSWTRFDLVRIPATPLVCLAWPPRRLRTCLVYNKSGHASTKIKPSRKSARISAKSPRATFVCNWRDWVWLALSHIGIGCSCSRPLRFLIKAISFELRGSFKKQRALNRKALAQWMNLLTRLRRCVCKTRAPTPFMSSIFIKPKVWNGTPLCTTLAQTSWKELAPHSPSIASNRCSRPRVLCRGLAATLFQRAIKAQWISPMNSACKSNSASSMLRSLGPSKACG